MDMNLQKAFELLQEFGDRAARLDRTSFLSLCCMMFDTYHAYNNDFDPVEAAQDVADCVRQVNETLGTFEA